MVLNIGIAKAKISQKLVESFMKNGDINDVNQHIVEFVDVLKNSPILQLEFVVFNNIENKQIKNDFIATKYIDDNIRMFEKYDTNDIVSEHEKLKKFMFEDVVIPEEKIKLYENISNVILESSKKETIPNVDLIHESFINVLNFIKENQINDNSETLNEAISIIDQYGIDGEVLIEMALNKFNEKYSSINESDLQYVNMLIKSSDDNKKELLDEWKNKLIEILNNVDKNGIDDKINESISKIVNMKYNKDTVVGDILSLYELKNNLLS